MKNWKIILLALMIFSPSIVLASNFDYVKSFRYSPETTFESLEFDDLVFDLPSFNQRKSVSSVKITNSSGILKLTFDTKNTGGSVLASTTIEAENENNEEVNCEQFDDDGIECEGGKLFVSLRKPGYKWKGETDFYMFSLPGGLLGFSNGTITGYKNGEEVVRINLIENSFRFSYSRFPDKAYARFNLEGGQAEWINEPVNKVVDTSNFEWNFENFEQTRNGGRGSIRMSSGFTGSITLNLQGNLNLNGSSYPIRNEIYANLDKLHYSDCPIFSETHILCNIRSGYIHSYIPGNKDSTLWKTYPRLFVLEILDGKASLTAGETSADDLFRISNINVVNFRFDDSVLKTVSSGTTSTTSTTTTSQSTTTTTTTQIAVRRNESFQKGMSFVSFGVNFKNPASAIQKLEDLKNTNTEWVAFVTTWYQDNLTATKIRNTSATPTDAYLTTMISKAKELGFKVVLKPHLNTLDDTDKGRINPGGGMNWHEWFESYRKFIYHYAELAEQNKVDMFTVGMELTSTQSQESEWRTTIAGVRERFSGKITYGPRQGNDAYQNVAWWDALDYAAVDAYFRLTNKCDPTFEELKAGWQSNLAELRTWQATVNKSVIFTEIGYAHFNCTNINPGSTDPHPIFNPSGTLDLQEQKDAYEAAFQTFFNETWLVGMWTFTWDGKTRTTPIPFAINNNPARDVVTNWYSKNWDSYTTTT